MRSVESASGPIVVVAIAVGFKNYRPDEREFLAAERSELGNVDASILPRNQGTPLLEQQSYCRSREQKDNGSNKSDHDEGQEVGPAAS